MDLNMLMKQAKKMQNDLASKEAELQGKIYEASVNGGVIKAVVTGRNQVEKIEIDASILEKENKELIEDMILMAVNEALGKMSHDKEAEMKSLTGGASIPGMF